MSNVSVSASVCTNVKVTFWNVALYVGSARAAGAAEIAIAAALIAKRDFRDFILPPRPTGVVSVANPSTSRPIVPDSLEFPPALRRSWQLLSSERAGKLICCLLSYLFMSCCTCFNDM
jgi:hypothetical protein